MGFVLHAGSCAAAAPVGNLEVFVHGGTTLSSDMTAAGDEAPGIQTGAALHGDAAAFLHLNIAVTAGGVAVVGVGAGVMLGTYADGTLYINGRSGSQSQGPVRCRGCRCGGIGRRSGIVSVGVVKGDHQGDAAGDRVSAAGQRAI